MEKKIKILRVVTQAEVVPWHLKNFLDRSVNDYTIYVAGNNVSRYKAEYPLINFIDVKIIRKSSPFHDLIALIKLIQICIKIRPDIVHSIMPKSGFLTALAGFFTLIPIRVHTFTGQVWATKSGIAKTLLKFMDKVIFYLNTRCLTDSPSQSTFLANSAFLRKGQQIHCLGKGSLSGVDLDRFKPASSDDKINFRQSIGLKPNDFVFVFLARKSVVKGIVELFASFEVFHSTKDVKLLFIGPDESNGVLKELYDKYQNISDQIISLDIVKEHENYLNASDVLCLPSSSEGFGTIVIEAAALKVPTIGFDIVGLSDAIENNQTGILVQFKNVTAFSDAMKMLYENQTKFHELRENARARILKDFSADAIYNLQKKFYQSLSK
ncbi:glycosyltransferase [Pedobacter aquatilis]|uniref:glycosyltransferase n=1 Tax=Pedobacter aquatilis TaxID=351343 RepID=UPI0029319A4C|nr:glycosyltransferase [Pedobacter aquatilis]